MMLKTLIFINLLGYAVIAGQAFFYMLAMANAQKNLKAPAYVELRNLLDRNLARRFRFVYYTVLATSILLCVFTAGKTASLLFMTSAIACLALWIDVFVMMKGNMPLNRLIQSWTPDNYPDNWKEYRAEWLRYYQLRQVAAVTGLLSLLVGAVFH
jgi:uncharacterized membrane protein